MLYLLIDIVTRILF